MLPALRNTLLGAGESNFTWQFEDGSEVLLLPHGGRILGLYPPGGGENFFWTHPDLEDPKSAQRLFSSADWHNPGGDRTWLAPEIDFFYPDYPKLDRYVQPRALDAARYEVHSTGLAPVLRNTFRARLFRFDTEAELMIEKEIWGAPNPLRYERGFSGGLSYAGYTLRTSLKVLEARGTEARVGLWNLLQLPHKGELVVPVFARPEPRVYFGNVGPEDLSVSEGLVVWRMRASGEHKIGIKAASTAGRAGYLYGAGERWNLVVRNFGVNPSGEYVDVPAQEPRELGYVFQACSIDSALGAFSELEYHAPAIRVAPEARSEDVSQLWAFRGSLEALEPVAAALLGYRRGERQSRR